ncbi:histidine phosphatase family protein [Litorimonas sp. RW-G-Af-16]|uniref:histidine phosphatase family protein n=1 Tax=Litorimonas sp. RW-G-Af-16 TaxID=3241168 RepID=UPI00390C5C5E
MSHDTIIIARHGKPALSRKQRMVWREYRDWWVKYDAGTIVPDQKVPKKLKKWAKKADILISSPLPRAYDSLVLAAGKEPDHSWPELVEAALPSPHLGTLKFRPKTWGTWSRIVWFWGWPDGMESHGEARQRANLAADKLGEQAAGGKIVYVSAHGWINRMIKGSLKKRGWKCVAQNGDLHWSFRRFTRPTQDEMARD